MSRVRIKLLQEGIREFLRSSDVYELCESNAKRVRSKLPEHGYSLRTYRNPGRASAVVVARTAKARRDNMKNNTLVKALSQAKE